MEVERREITRVAGARWEGRVTLAVMSELPSDTLALYDTRNALMGLIRFAPSERDATKGECIFDMDEPDSGAGDEVRWLYKHRYKTAGEHKFKLGRDGSITVSQADFRVVFAPSEEGDYRTVPPAPVVTAIFEE